MPKLKVCTALALTEIWLVMAGDAAAGIKKNSSTVFSAHQMGTARMGIDPKKSCVDPQGECWEVRSTHLRRRGTEKCLACTLIITDHEHH